MKIKNLISYLESIAPRNYQESYDNAGLIVGNPDTKIKGVLICLDSTEAVLEEAQKKGCNVVVAHHPIVFRGLKSLTGKNYVERVVMKAIREDIAIYAIHTNLDNVYHQGVNAQIAARLQLIDTQILAPKAVLKKLSVLVPIAHAQQVRKTLFAAGAGAPVGFERLSYNTIGVATSGKQDLATTKIEVLFPTGKQGAILAALHRSHPQTNIPYDILTTESKQSAVGAGMVGYLKEPVQERAFLESLKKRMKASCVRYTRLRGKKVRKVAICGGSGSFLLQNAIAQQADVFVTADFKYHEFFDADRKIVIADIGHYETEQFTIELLHEIITNKF
ncbi:MAG: Nif3-like dinuclear metal center hexameric protein, partial [Bacteroidota bacterium]